MKTHHNGGATNSKTFSRQRQGTELCHQKQKYKGSNGRNNERCGAITNQDKVDYLRIRESKEGEHLQVAWSQRKKGLERWQGTEEPNSDPPK